MTIRKSTWTKSKTKKKNEKEKFLFLHLFSPNPPSLLFTFFFSFFSLPSKRNSKKKKKIKKKLLGAGKFPPLQWDRGNFMLYAARGEGGRFIVFFFFLEEGFAMVCISGFRV